MIILGPPMQSGEKKEYMCTSVVSFHMLHKVMAKPFA